MGQLIEHAAHKKIGRVFGKMGLGRQRTTFRTDGRVVGNTDAKTLPEALRWIDHRAEGATL